MKESSHSQIIRTSLIGVVTNVLLAGLKAAVGFLANSIAIIMDAVNNLSDALSSVITIIGTILSRRPGDRKHPYGLIPGKTILVTVDHNYISWVCAMPMNCERFLTSLRTKSLWL